MSNPNTAEEIQPKVHRQIRMTIHDARMGNVDIEESHNFICELMQEHTAQTLDRLKEEVGDRISDIRDYIHEIEDKMNRYTFSEKEKKEGSTHYGALQEREVRYKRQVQELKDVLQLIKEVSDE